MTALRLVVVLLVAYVAMGQNTSTPTTSSSPNGTATSTPSPSVNATADRNTTSNSSSVCFPGDAFVVMADWSLKAISKLEIGDQVSDGRGGSSPVFMFGHRLATVEETFVEISAKSRSESFTLDLSPSHFLPVNGKLLAARLVKANDQVTVVSGDGEAAEATVTGVRSVRKTGLYNPHTLDGSIVVNGVVASCYTETVRPSLAHLLLAPFRLVYPVVRNGLDTFTGPLNRAGSHISLRDGKAMVSLSA
eukprot:CAMPEP_0184684728 /NCGR_PEP_ID=MMETSP0312-20130426/16498_1 /TAXON_ID=31354 /ORGANISM="Compsopogon coeruleus, Strain SAG 36.94" /LENGTH=247 /DNA_ID=CAMNT_0027138223 /DNA_START=60 /DNA_END=803 /DNA_ORIENTATION=+